MENRSIKLMPGLVIICMIPVLPFIVDGIFPVNVSKLLLLICCEVFAAIVILIVAINRNKIIGTIQNRLNIFISTCMVLLLILVTTLGFFTNIFTSKSEFGDRVLLPLNCKGELCELQAIALKKGESIAAHLGKDLLIDKINVCCKPELMQSQLIYFLLVVFVFSLLVFIFMTLGIFYEDQKNKSTYIARLIKTPKSNYKIYIDSYLDKSKPENKTQLKFHIFLSYSSDHKQHAEALSYSLLNNRHMVFFDKNSLPEAGEYNVAINNAVNCSDLMIFLISPESVKPGGYTHTELRYAREKWPSAAGHLLPVMASEIPFPDIPEYAKSVTVFKPEGNLVAEVTNEVENMYRDNSTKKKGEAE